VRGSLRRDRSEVVEEEETKSAFEEAGKINLAHGCSDLYRRLPFRRGRAPREENNGIRKSKGLSDESLSDWSLSSGPLPFAFLSVLIARCVGALLRGRMKSVCAEVGALKMN